jgi:hypothetical protein
MKPSSLKTVVIGVGIVLLVLVSVAGFFLYRGIAHFARSEKELAAARQDLDRLYSRDPFPSAENVAQERQNLEALSAEFSNFVERLSVGQMEPQDRSPREFMDVFWKTQQALMADARRHRVLLPDNFLFGFDAYGAGKPPESNNVPRLTQQLGVITNLCNVLYEAGVTDISALTREPFDTSAAGADPAAEAAAGAGLFAPNSLHAKMRFGLEFRASEAAVIAVLNRFANSALFVVVAEVQMAADGAGVTLAGRALSEAPPRARSVAATEDSAAKKDRIVAGTERPMKVRMAVDVYRFRKGTEQ